MEMINKKEVRMNQRFVKKLSCLLVILLLLLGMGQTGKINVAAGIQAAGDDPGVTISGPQDINSNGMVDLSGTLSGSA